jgi:hypothetical protein
MSTSDTKEEAIEMRTSRNLKGNTQLEEVLVPRPGLSYKKLYWNNEIFIYYDNLININSRRPIFYYLPPWRRMVVALWMKRLPNK